ncbi:MAG: tetratricopeptide repeat protein [Nitrospinae bacterium]|nr:tetratricopeptide repeat protein [Nitrospinota bacterium]
MDKRIFSALAAVTGIAAFALGFNMAIGAPVILREISFAEVEGHTRMTLSAEGEIKFRLKLDKPSKSLTIHVMAERPKEAPAIKYGDSMVESVTLHAGSEPGTQDIMITFKQPDFSFYRADTQDPNRAVFDFRTKDEGLKITGVTPEKLVAQAAATPAKEEAKPEEPEQAADQAAAGEAEAGKVAESEKPEAPTPDSAAIGKMFAQVDETYDKLEKDAGRGMFQDVMGAIQKREYEQAVELADSFFKEYPKSVYLEKAYFSKGDALYLLSKKEKTNIPRALDAYKEAISMFPKSELVQRAMMRKSSLYEDQEFDIEAVVELNMAQKVDAKSKYAVVAMINKAKIFARQKKFARAQAELQKILTLYPNRREARDVKYLIAEAYFDQEKYKEALDVFEESMKLWPTYPKAHPATFLKIAESHLKLGQTARAMENLMSVANLFPGSTTGRKALLMIGDINLKENKRKDAVKIFEALAVKFPDTPESVMARLRLATLGAEEPELLRHSDIFDYTAFENPMKTFDEVKAKYAEKLGEEALMRKGRALTARKQYVSAILAYKELLKSYPATRMSDDVFALVRGNILRLIETYHSQDGFLLTLATYYNNFDPFLKTIAEPDVLIKLADSFGAMTLYGRSAEYYRLADAVDKKGEFKAVTRFRLAKAILYDNKARDAEEMLRAYIKEFPAHPNAVTARHYLGTAMMEQKQPAEAATEWRLAIERDPRHFMTSNTAYKLGMMYKGEQRYSLAADAFSTALAVFRPEMKLPEEPDYMKDCNYQLADSYYRGEDYASAIRQAERFKAKYAEDPRNSWMDYIISMSLEKGDQDEAAMTKLRDLSDKDKSTPVGRVAAARLKNVEWKKKNPNLFQE